MLSKASRFLAKNFYAIATAVLLLRLAASFFPSFWIDMGNWIIWARRLAAVGWGGFYSDFIWTNYTPGFFYHLGLLGFLDKFYPLNNFIFPVLIKLPVILADFGVGLLIYRLLKKKSEIVGILGFLFYTLNPAIVFADSIWGQTDGLISLFLILSAVYLAEKKKLVWGWFFWSLALLVKPQALAALPLLVVFSVKHFKLKKIWQLIVTILATPFIAGLPFFQNNPVFGLPQIVLKMTNESPFTSVMAFNFWALARGMWISDQLTFLGIKYFVWGMVLLVLALLAILIKIYRQNFTKPVFYEALGLSYLVFFLFPTRVHERYLLPALAFLLISALLTKAKTKIEAYLALSILSLINLYYPYAYYNQNYLRNEFLLTASRVAGPFVAVGFLIIFLGTLLDWKLPKIELKLPQFTTKTWLYIILSFAFLSRILFLGNPANEYFDEVYHAFTARQILHQNKMAWEWWNVPPEGFAYEWTHPPLAKLGMVMGMFIFGENAFGWRIPGALLGVASVYLVFLIAKKLFNDEKVGLLSAAVFSLDGLPLVISRIGMNDSYLLFFVLLAIHLFLKQKNFLSALALGLALSSKWSGLWAIPILGILNLQRKDKFTPGLLWFFLLPPLVYLANYLPFFFSGHAWPTFIELQKQMWWYHTRLRATHSYTSLWWTWPFLVRPIYLYTSGYLKGFVANIYAMGNPAVFWGGFLAILSGIYTVIIEKNKKLAFVIFTYLMFFVPWAISPRIMFLYHYLPSLPFLAIATGYFLRRNPKLAYWTLGIGLLVFIYFYPHWAGIKIPQGLDTSYYWFSSWR